MRNIFDNKGKPAANKVWDVISEAENNRLLQEQDWYIGDRWYDGDHYVYFDRLNNKIETVKPQKGQVLRSIPKTTKQIDTMVNMLSSGDFRWTAKPTLSKLSADEESDVIAQKIGRWLKCKFAELDMTWKLVEIALLGFKFPVAYFWPGYDENTGKFYVDIYDAFDIYFDKPNITDPDQASIMIKTFTRDVDELQADPRYKNTKGLKPTTTTAASQVKDAREKEKYGGFKVIASNDVQCAQQYRKRYERVGDGKNTVMHTYMEVMTVTQNRIIRGPEKIQTDKFPIVMYKPKPGPIYGKAWIHHFISLNKSLDSLCSSIEGYGQQLAKPRLLAAANQQVKVTETPTAILVEYTGGSMAPAFMNTPPLPKELSAQAERIEKYIEETGVSGINLSQIPTQIKAAAAIESLKEADYANLTTAVISIKKALSGVANRLIELAAENMITPEPVEEKDSRSDERFFVAGEAAKKFAEATETEDEIPENTVFLYGTCKAMVEIENGLGHTEAGKQETILLLHDKGLIDNETALEAFKFGNVAEILERLADERQVSIVDAEEFHLLPKELQIQILTFLSEQAPVGDGETLPDSVQAGGGAQ